ncbi:MAG: nucleoside deaminase [Rhodospirillales bacterium]
MPDPDSPMAAALAAAKSAAELDEVPVGAVIVDPGTGRILAAGGNLVEASNDPTAHAEIVAIRNACATLGQPRLDGYDLYVTLEPCAMCAQAIAHARLRRLYFGAYDPKGGGVEHGARVFDRETCHHRPEIYGGIREAEASELLRDFFRSRRD